MSQRIVVDPVSRIPGHCRAELDMQGNIVRQASVGGTMWRGVEGLVIGRGVGEAWAFAERSCGSCSPAHAIASVRAAERALGAEVAANAQLVRNIMIAAHAVGEHLNAYYQRALPDWASGETALNADPQLAADLARQIVPATPLTAPGLRRLQERLRDSAGGAGGRLFFGALPSDRSELDPQHALVAIGHSLAALDAVRDAGAVIATVAGKMPHVQNLAVGGVATAIALDDPATLNMTRLQSLVDLFERLLRFTEEVFLPDVAAIAARFPEWMRPAASLPLLAFPELPIDTRSTVYDLPGGTLIGGALRKIDAEGLDEVLARIATSNENTWNAEGEGTEGAYSWARSVRLDGKPAEVGPAAQVLIAQAAGHGLTERRFRDVDGFFSARAGNHIPAGALVSPMGRHLARAVRVSVMAELGRKYAGALIENVGRGDLAIRIPPSERALDGKGIGIHETPHGALIHEIGVSDGKVSEYRVIAPANWNAGPRTADGTRGPCETALVGATVRDASRPVEIMRALHSFAPCMSCASA
jgi:hydrogenase large subunit